MSRSPEEEGRNAKRPKLVAFTPIHQDQIATSSDSQSAESNSSPEESSPRPRAPEKSEEILQILHQLAKDGLIQIENPADLNSKSIKKSMRNLAQIRKNRLHEKVLDQEYEQGRGRTDYPETAAPKRNTEKGSRLVRKSEGFDAVARSMTYFSPIRVKAKQNPREGSVESVESVGSEESEESKGSEDVAMQSAKIKKIIIKTESSYDKKGRLSVAFKINQSQRFDTIMSNGLQGDHHIAHLVIVEAILNSTNLSISSAIDSFEQFAKSILKDESLEKFKSVERPKTHDTQARQIVHNLVTNVSRNNDLIKQSLGDSEEMRYLHKNGSQIAVETSRSMKNDKIAKLTTYLASLTEIFLESIQKENLTTSYSRGRIGQNPNHGDLVKGASRALVMIDKLCKLCSLQGRDFEEELKFFTSALRPREMGSQATEQNHIARYGLNRWNEAKKEVDGEDTLPFADPDALKQMLQSAQKAQGQEAKEGQAKKILQSLKENILTRDDLMTKFLGNLVDYNYQIEFYTGEITGDKNSSKPANKKELEGNFNPDDHLISSQDDNSCTVTRKEPKNLYLILRKYKKLIEHAFKNLVTDLGEDKFEEVFAKFIEENILETQGWKNCKTTSPEGAEVGLSSGEIMKQISEYSNIEREGQASPNFSSDDDESLPKTPPSPRAGEAQANRASPEQNLNNQPQ